MAEQGEWPQCKDYKMIESTLKKSDILNALNIVFKGLERELDEKITKLRDSYVGKLEARIGEIRHQQSQLGQGNGTTKGHFGGFKSHSQNSLHSLNESLTKPPVSNIGEIEAEIGEIKQKKVISRTRLLRQRVTLAVLRIILEFH